MHLKSQKRQVPTHNDNLIQKTDQHIHSIVYVLFQFPFMPILTTLWRVGAAIRLHYEPIKQAGAERRGGQRRRGGGSPVPHSEAVREQHFITARPAVTQVALDGLMEAH